MILIGISVESTSSAKSNCSLTETKSSSGVAVPPTVLIPHLNYENKNKRNSEYRFILHMFDNFNDYMTTIFSD